MKMFTVYDCKAQTYLNPFCMGSLAEAIRSFETAVKDPQTMFHQYPSDFSLLELGEFDQHNGSISLLNTPTIIANATEFKH